MVEAGSRLADLIGDAAHRLARAGFDEPRREAVRVWSGLRDESPAAALLHADAVVEAPAADAFRQAVARRLAGEPLAYVTGSTGFRTLTLRTDRRALIPRAETEGLVELMLREVRGGRVADIGTGTGCIALSLRAEGAYEAVVAVDLSADALDLAAENARLCRLEVELLRADLTTAFGADSLDALVSNPPYLTVGEHAALAPAVRDWEPVAALPSGADGMDATFRLLADAQRVVRPGGLLVLEADCTRAAAVAERAQDLGWTDIAVAHDLFERERYVLARREPQS